MKVYCYIIENCDREKSKISQGKSEKNQGNCYLKLCGHSGPGSNCLKKALLKYFNRRQKWTPFETRLWAFMPGYPGLFQHTSSFINVVCIYL